MIIKGITIRGTQVYDSSFNSNGALLYVDAAQNISYVGSGTNWVDLSVNNNNATISGNPAYNSSTGYFTFTGNGAQYASTPTAKYNVTYTGKTVMLAARMSSSSWTSGVDQYRCLFGTPTGTRNFNTYMHHDSSNNLQIHYSANNLGGFSNNLSLATNQWFIVSVTHTTGGLVTYYLNGQAVGTNTGVTFSQWATNGGENIAYADNYWYGDIAMCAVYGRALSADEITQNFNSLRSRYSL